MRVCWGGGQLRRRSTQITACVQCASKHHSMYVNYSCVRAGDNTNGYYSVLLDTSSVWRGRAPEITVSKSTKFHELDSIHIVGYIALRSNG